MTVLLFIGAVLVTALFKIWREGRRYAEVDASYSERSITELCDYYGEEDEE